MQARPHSIHIAIVIQRLCSFYQDCRNKRTLHPSADCCAGCAGVGWCVTAIACVFRWYPVFWSARTGREWRCQDCGWAVVAPSTGWQMIALLYFHNLARTPHYDTFAQRSAGLTGQKEGETCAFVGLLFYNVNKNFLVSQQLYRPFCVLISFVFLFFVSLFHPRYDHTRLTESEPNQTINKQTKLIFTRLNWNQPNQTNSTKAN